MSVVDSGQALCIAALAEAGLACTVIPAAWPLLAEIGLLYSDPGQMEQASGHWKDAATKLQSLTEDMSGLAKGVPEDKWSAQDRAAFMRAVDQYKAELTQVHDFHHNVAEMLQIAAYLYFAGAVLAFTLAQMLAIQAIAIVAASWTIVGAAAIEAVANSLAAAFDGILSAATLGIKALIGVIVGIIGAGSLVYALAQSKASNPSGSGPISFQKATLAPIGGVTGPPTTA